ncbi:hypothetical protein ACFLS8_04365 [Chloroflexota bacterium]
MQPELLKNIPGTEPTIADIKFKDCKHLVERRDYALGTSQNPLFDEELIA